MNKELLATLFGKLAVPIDTTAEAFNVGEAAVRAGIERKEIPTTGFGRTLMVPTAFIRERLMLDQKAAA